MATTKKLMNVAPPKKRSVKGAGAKGSSPTPQINKPVKKGNK